MFGVNGVEESELGGCLCMVRRVCLTICMQESLEIGARRELKRLECSFLEEWDRVALFGNGFMCV